MAAEIQRKSEKEIEVSPPLENDEEYDYITVPPDGGFGWVVLLACFFINFIIDGFIYAFGNLSKKIKEEYECKEWAVTLVVSLAIGFYLLSGPIVSALCNKWGCRPVGIVGSIIAASAIALSTASTNIIVMWLLFGLVGGIGFGLVYLPSFVMVGYYFEAKRAIATGIVAAGTGVGTMLIGPLANKLLEKFVWKAVVRLLSLIILCCAVCCAFMRPLKPVRKRRVLHTTDIIDEKTLKLTTPTPSLKQAKIPEISITPASVNIEDTNVLEVAFDEKTGKRSRTQSAVSTRSGLSAKSGVSVKSRQSIKAEDAVRPLYKEDVLYQGDTQDLPEFQAQPDIPTYVQETTKIPEEDNKPSSMKAFWDILQSMTNIHLLRDKNLLIICVANIFSMLGYYSPFLFMIPLASGERNIPSNSAVKLVSMIGFSNTACRFISGWTTKIPYMTPLLIHNITLSLAGIVTLGVPFCKTFESLAVFCIVWGCLIAFHMSLSPAIVCQLVGLEQYSNALGLTLLFRGITSLCGPPILGGIRDMTKSFNTPFVISGLCLIISAALHCILFWTTRTPKIEAAEGKTTNQSHTNPAAQDV